VTLKGA